MADETNEVDAQSEVDAAEAEVESLEAEPEEAKDTTDWKAKFEEAEGRRKRAETRLERLKVDKKVEKVLEKKSGELDDTALDYLDLKGITEDEDIQIVETVVKRTGMTVRQALKDDYVIKKLEFNKAAREVKDATPSATKRSSGGQSNDLQSAIARYEATGEYPKDFELRDKVVDALMKRSSNNAPTWRR